MRILWIPHASWATPQRARWFCQELAQRHTVHVTDWVADFRSPRDYLSGRYPRNFTYRRSRDGEIVVHGIPRFSPALFVPLLRKLNSALFSRYATRIISRERIDVVVGSFVAPPPRAPRLIFDQFDDNVRLWEASGRFPGYAAEIARVEQAYLAQADAVVAVSTVLVDRLNARGYRKAITLIPNPVRLNEFRRQDGEVLRSRQGLVGPIVGLVGKHDRWSELDRVLRAVRLISDVSATLLIVGGGAALKRAQHVVRELALTNVRFIGQVPPDEVAPWFMAIDVGLCPYNNDPADAARSPLRLLSHSAAGSPVVCTDLEEIRRMGFPNVILVDQTPAALADGIRQGLSMPRERPAAIHAYDIRVLTRRYERVLAGEVDSADEAS